MRLFRIAALAVFLLAGSRLFCASVPVGFAPMEMCRPTQWLHMRVVDLGRVYERNMTPLHCAVLAKRVDALNLLMDALSWMCESGVAGVDDVLRVVTAIDADGNTALHLGAMCKCPAVISAFVHSRLFELLVGCRPEAMRAFVVRRNADRMAAFCLASNSVIGGDAEFHIFCDLYVRLGISLTSQARI